MVEIDRRVFYVVPRPQNGANVYLAGPNEPKLFEVVASGEYSLPSLNRENPATETKNSAQFRRQALKQPHRWFDRSYKLPQHAGDGIPLGECRLESDSDPPAVPT